MAEFRSVVRLAHSPRCSAVVDGMPSTQHDRGVACTETNDAALGLSAEYVQRMGETHHATMIGRTQGRVEEVSFPAFVPASAWECFNLFETSGSHSR